MRLSVGTFHLEMEDEIKCKLCDAILQFNISMRTTLIMLCYAAN